MVLLAGGKGKSEAGWRWWEKVERNRRWSFILLILGRLLKIFCLIWWYMFNVWCLILIILFLAVRSRDPVATGRRGGSEGRGGRGVQVREGKGGCHHLLASLLSSSSVRGRSVQVSGIVVVIIFCQHQHSSQTSEFIFSEWRQEDQPWQCGKTDCNFRASSGGHL